MLGCMGMVGMGIGVDRWTANSLGEVNDRWLGGWGLWMFCLGMLVVAKGKDGCAVRSFDRGGRGDVL